MGSIILSDCAFIVKKSQRQDLGKEIIINEVLLEI